MHKERSFLQTTRCRMDDAIHAAFSLAKRHPGADCAYEHLLSVVQQRTSWLRPTRTPDRLSHCITINAALLPLALHHGDWIRPPEAWQPPLANPWPQFASLAQHLFALYPLPNFMTSAWFLLPPDEPLREHHWYKQLGRGHSVRSLDLPVRFTRAMAHHFLHAPDHYSIAAALRWAQVRGLGGNEPLARAVAASRLGREFGNEEFWLTALQFFVNHPRLDTIHVGPIVDFLQHQKFEPRQIFVPGRGVTEQGPPCPDYSLKGRSPASLLRQVEQWHRELGRQETMPALIWKRSPIGELHYIEGSNHQEAVRCWTLRELLTSRELFLEGQALNHCVSTYARSCASRLSSIWSLQVDTGHGPHRVLTIEVNLTRRTICQARGKSNRPPRQAERNVLARWAAQEGLIIADHL